MDYYKELCSLMFILTYMIIAAFSYGFANNLKKSKDRSPGNMIACDFLGKHINYINIFTLVWTAYLANGFYLLYMKANTINKMASYNDFSGDSQATILSSLWFIELTFYLILFQGILLCLVRFNEPLFTAMFKRELLSWFGELYEYKAISERHTEYQLMN